MMTQILLNLHESYDNIVENIEYELDENSNPLTIERIHDKIL